MREILFRGKRVDNKRWVQGYLSFVYWDVPEKARIYSPDEARRFDVITETVGQYTGLTDKNGLTKIFEGDIVRVQNLKLLYEVYWDKREARFKARNGGRVSPLCNTYDVFVEEVVGNVFDNPELLKGSAKNE